MKGHLKDRAGMATLYLVLGGLMQQGAETLWLFCDSLSTSCAFLLLPWCNGSDTHYQANDMAMGILSTSLIHSTV